MFCASTVQCIDAITAKIGLEQVWDFLENSICLVQDSGNVSMGRGRHFYGTAMLKGHKKV